MKTRVEVYKGKYDNRRGYLLDTHIRTFYPRAVPHLLTYRLRKIFSLFGIVVLTVYY